MQSVLSEEVILSCQRQEPLTSHPQLKPQNLRVIKRSQSSKLVHEQRGQQTVLQLKQQQSLPQPLHPPPTPGNVNTDHLPNGTNSVSILVYKALNTVFKNSRKIIVRVCDVTSVKKSLTMFKFNKAAAQHRAENRANNCTGHDQFVRPPVSDKKAKHIMKKLQKQNGLTRSNSAIEFDVPTLTATGRRQIYSCNRSASSEQDNSDQSEHSEKSPLVNVRLDNLARLFFSKSMPSENGSRNNMHSLAWIRPNLKSQYSALDSGNRLNDRGPRDRAHRNYVLNAIQEWVQNSSGRYEIIVHLDEIGSRRSKNWFLVNDSSVRTDRLMTLLPLPADCIAHDYLPEDECPRKILMELLGSLHHPYIYPVLDLSFLRIDSTNYACLVTPFNSRGSLKDLIYKAQWNEPWSVKYSRKPTGLPTTQIQRLGRQILEALLFLKERGFPLHGHLHSGNVILQNGAARLAGLENGLLGLSSGVNAVVWSRSTTEIENVDIICFGYLLYEMCTGVEMTTPKPSIKMLEMELENYPQVDLRSLSQILDILSLIFEPPAGICPSVEELVLCDLFRSIDLRELRGSCFSTIKPSLSRSTLSLLQAVKKRQSSLLGQSLSETVSPCTPPPTPHDKRLRAIKGAFHSSLDPEECFFDEFVFGYDKDSTEICHTESPTSGPLSQLNLDSQEPQVTGRQRKIYHNDNSLACSNHNENFTFPDRSLLDGTLQNHHFNQQLPHPALHSSLTTNSITSSLARKVVAPNEIRVTENPTTRKVLVLNSSKSIAGFQPTMKKQLETKSETNIECQTTNSIVPTLAVAATSEGVRKNLWNGLFKSVCGQTSHYSASDASPPNHQLTADMRNYNNSKSRRLEYSLKCSKYDRSNTSQDSAFGSLTDGDLSTSSCRLSSFQSVSSPIDEGVEDVIITAATNATNEVCLELGNLKNKLVSQDSAISSPCRELNYFKTDDSLKGSGSDGGPACPTSNVRPVSLSPKIIVAGNVSSSPLLTFTNSSQQFDPPKILVNDQSSIYTNSPSKRFGTIEVFSQKYRVSSFEDMSTNNISDQSGKHARYTNQLIFHSLENERRIDNAFKPIKERTNSDVGVNRNSDKYKKLTHASFRISKTASQVSVFNFSQDLHVSNTPAPSSTDLPSNFDAASPGRKLEITASSGAANKRQTVWRDSKLYHENHITKSNDSLLETPSNNLVGLSLNSSLLDHQSENFLSLDNASCNTRNRLRLSRHGSVNEILNCNQNLDIGLTVTVKPSCNPTSNHHYCSSKSEDFGDTENHIYVMDSKKSYSERYLVDYTEQNHGASNGSVLNCKSVCQSQENHRNYTGEERIYPPQWDNAQQRNICQKRQKARKLYSTQNSPHRHTKCARTHPNFLSLSTCSINRITTTKVRTTSLATPSLLPNNCSPFQHIRSKTITSFESLDNSLKFEDTCKPIDRSNTRTAAEFSSADELSSRPKKNRVVVLSKLFAADNVLYGSCGEEKRPLLDSVEMSPMSPTGPELDNCEQM